MPRDPRLCSLGPLPEGVYPGDKLLLVILPIEGRPGRGLSGLRGGACVLGAGWAGPGVSRHCGSLAAAEPTRSACYAMWYKHHKHRAKCVRIPNQTAGGTWERPRVSFHDDRDRGSEGQGRGHSSTSLPREAPPSKTAVFRAELPERGQAQPSLRPGLILDFSILG